MWLKLAALLLPLGLDTFAVAASLGLAGISARDRFRISWIFAGFEMGMPLVGFFAGSLLGGTIGGVADYLAILILLALGIYMVWPRHDELDEQRVSLLARTGGWAAIGLGVSISLDELAIGFTLGLLRFPVALLVFLIGLQAFLLTQLGIRLGQRLGEQTREGAERLAGMLLSVLGVGLLIEKLAS
jgi:putative Mn2+ efflux pump MntP